MESMRERSHTSWAGLWKGFLAHAAFYVIWPHTLATLLHKARGVRIRHAHRVRIASNVLIDSLYPELIEIEDDVFITRGVAIVAHFTPTPYLRRFIPEVQFGSVCIKRGAYIGVHAIVLPGVTIGEGCIIGAGSVVTSDIPDFSVAVGNPARVIRRVDEMKGAGKR